MRFLKCTGVLLFLLLCCNAFAETTSQSFSLESPLSGTIYGPFVLQDNFVAEINSTKYLIKLSSNGFMRLKSIDKDVTSEPYEFMQGRMIRLDNDLFTIVSVNEIPYVQPLPAPAPKVAPKPQPVSVIKPVAATAAVAATTVAVAKTPKPSVSTEPASKMWADAVAKNNPAPVKRTPLATTKPTYKPATKPVSDTVPYFSTSKYKKPRNSDSGSYYKLRTSPTSKPSAKSKIRPYKGIPFSERLGVSVDISAMEKVNYDYKLSGLDGSSEAEISRNSMGVKFKVMPFTLELGKVMRADWSGEMATPDLPFTDVNLRNGSGWWWNLNYSHSLWEQDGWLLAATADGSYRKEDYDLSYGALTESQIVIPPEGTNGIESIETITDLATTTQSAVFTEKMFQLGLSMSYKTDYWACWAAADLIAYHAADIESTIDTTEGSYTIDVERTNPFILTFGASIKKAGVNWFSTINILGESAIRVGANYKF